MGVSKDQVKREDGGYDCPYMDDAGGICTVCEGTRFLVQHQSPGEVQQFLRQNADSARAKEEHFPTATIQLNRSGEHSTRLAEYRLADLRITSYHTTSDAGGQTPLETVSFTFSQLVAQYYAVAADGSVDEAIAGGWDLRQNIRI